MYQTSSDTPSRCLLSTIFLFFFFFSIVSQAVAVWEEQFPSFFCSGLFLIFFQHFFFCIFLIFVAVEYMPGGDTFARWSICVLCSILYLLLFVLIALFFAGDSIMEDILAEYIYTKTKIGNISN